MKAPIPDDEWSRLQALARYAVLDTLPEAAFDRLTALTAKLLRAKLAVINFVDEDRQWGKSVFGADDTEAPREDSFCAWTILGDDVFVVPDATRDARFVDNPMVTGEPHIRLYAGAPLITPDGFRIGSLCVTDDRPRDLSPDEAEHLRTLAELVMDELELRRALVDAERRAAALEETLGALRRALAASESRHAVADLLDLDLSTEDVARHGAALLSRHVDADVISLAAVRGDEARAHTVWTTPRGRRLVDGDGADERGGAAPEAPDGGHVTTSRRAQGGLVFEVAESRGTLFVDDYGGAPGARPHLVAAGARACACAYVGEHDGVRYVLVCARVDEDRPWGEADRAQIRTAARTLGAVLSRAAHLDTLAGDARRDALTGLGNRRALEDALAAPPAGYGVAVVDVDGLKAVNDTEGHARGDALLRLFATALVAEAPASALVCRLGGDEFVLVDAGALDAPTWEARVERAVTAATATVRGAGFPGAGASLGTALGTEASSPAATLDLADRRMYRDKRRGRGPDEGPGAGDPPSSEPEASPGPPDGLVRRGPLALDVRRGVATLDGREARLTRTEARMLAVLMRFPGRVFSREELAREAWPGEEGPGGNTLDVHVSNVRRKLAALSPDLGVRAVRGAGYRLQLGPG